VRAKAPTDGQCTPATVDCRDIVSTRESAAELRDNLTSTDIQHARARALAIGARA
jgi:hypothetical protein